MSRIDEVLDTPVTIENLDVRLGLLVDTAWWYGRMNAAEEACPNGEPVQGAVKRASDAAWVDCRKLRRAIFDGVRELLRAAPSDELGEPLAFDDAEPTHRVSYVDAFGVRHRATVERYIVTGFGREDVKIGDTWFARHQWIAADVRKESADV